MCSGNHKYPDSNVLFNEISLNIWKFSKNGRNLNKFKVQYHALFLTIVVFPFLFVIHFYFQQIKEAKEDLSRKGFKFDDT